MADLKNEDKKGEIASGSNVPFVTSIIEDIWSPMATQSFLVYNGNQSILQRGLT